MSHVLKYAAELNEAEKTATMHLFGALGGDVNGHYFASDLMWLGDRYENIVVLINSEGGSVFQGLSIVNAIRNTKANVTAKIEGLALSMAGFLAVTCDRVEMSDFSRLMIHDPLIPGKAKLSEKEKKGLGEIKAVLNKILTARSGKTTEEISEIMALETWYTAEEALAFGLIDSIIETGVKISASENDFLSVKEEILLAVAQLHQPTNQKTDKMKDLAAHFGLEAEATQEEILAKVQETQTALQSAQDQVSAKDAEIAALTETLTLAKQTAAASLVDVAIAQGKIKAEAKEKMVKLATESPETFEALLEGVSAKAPRIFQPAAQKTEGGEDRSKWTYDDFQKKDPAALSRMMSEDAERFDALFAAHYGNK